MILCIAEKPSVARDIASLLKANNRSVKSGVGYLEGNGYLVTWTFGHLCTLKEPHDYDLRWKSWSLGSLPMIPERFGIKPIDLDLYQRQLAIIQELVQRATLVINCGDAGQEGELIQRWVLQMVGCKVPVKRLWVSSLTDEALRIGFENLRDEKDFQPLYEAGMARAIGDWLLGINATRLYTSRYTSGRGQILSIGRVQTPTLALIVHRQQEIERFQPEIYWTLKTIYRNIIFSSETGRYGSIEVAQRELEQIKEYPLIITKIDKKSGKELPPKLFDLTSLQVTCNKKFGMSAEETLTTIQGLYEKKLTTYPRVDTTYLSEDIFSKVREILVGLTDYRELVIPILESKTIRKSKKVFDNSKVTDHHAIIPTGQPAHGLSPQEQLIFNLIVRHFIAVFYPECIVSTTTVYAQINGIKFKTSGKEILSLGWRSVFTQEEAHTTATEATDQDSSETDRIIPNFSKGESGDHHPDIKEGKTSPPSPYTEATLLRAMETAGKSIEDDDLRELMKENGIGRPSTRANIIETLLKRGYIVKEKRNQLRATITGVRLINTINFKLLKSAELTGQWEYKLRQIEKQVIRAQDFIAELKTMVYTLVQNVLDEGTTSSNETDLPLQDSPHPPCPQCGQGYIIRGHNAYGCSAYKSGCSYRISFQEYNQTYLNIKE